jgi:hypothetical protein
MSPRAARSRSAGGSDLLRTLSAALRGSAPAQRVRGWLVFVAALGGGLVLGAALGFLLSLLLAGVPGVPSTLLSFGAGSLVGAAAALVLASRSSVVRKGGAWMLLATPLLVLAAPFLLLFAGAAAHKRPASRGP